MTFEKNKKRNNQEKILHYHFANANHPLDQFLPRINQAIELTEKYAIDKLSIKHPIDIIFTDALDQAIPEDGVGGHTYRSDFVTICLDSNNKDLKVDQIFGYLCHELNHAARWQNNPEWSDNFVKSTLLEGLATAFQIQAIEENNLELGFFAKTIFNQNQQEIEQLIKKTDLKSKEYDYYQLFITGNDKLPRWTGYQIGYYLIKKYLAKTKNSAHEVACEKYAEIIAKIEL